MKIAKKILFVCLILICFINMNTLNSFGQIYMQQKLKNLDKTSIDETLENLTKNDIFKRIGKCRETNIETFIEQVYAKVQLKEKENTSQITKKNIGKNVDYNEVFKNDVFIGDSITDGLSCYGVLNDDLIITKTGMHVYEALNLIDTIVNKNPDNVYIHLGINDIDTSFTSEIYAGYYLKLIKELKEKLPNTNIYIQSILPVIPVATKAKAVLNNEYIDEYNDQIIELAKSENVNYLNIGEILENEDESIYAKDGIHFKETFYNKWLDYIILMSKKGEI
ncbi:GDSL-type esterase/lipase family protein [Clostridium grantii]|uniref:GDSL-like Lipase/Acylhydrolase n=1 Tax=Clostridium grantii DSM 8605 TaxID=1121316 RepID=A0A1M5XAJ2_9CLOT|nr:GDSL-type esterase/lipase family protein [Clostridium grantii]SHH96821.1 GDSL-like Lipase/Acylhydrolase [Clostridium grantii DSM 8605]